jgi:hypothetical protein
MGKRAYVQFDGFGLSYGGIALSNLRLCFAFFLPFNQAAFHVIEIVGQPFMALFCVIALECSWIHAIPPMMIIH